MRASNLMKTDGSNESAMMVFAHAHVYISLCTNSYVLRRRNTRYKNPQLVAQHCFVASFGSMFHVFHLAWSTCRAKIKFVAGRRNAARWLVDLLGVDLIWRHFLAWQVVSLMKNEQQSQNLLLKVDQRSAFRNTFPQPATNVFVVGQVDRARWKTGACNETMLRDKLGVFVSRISPPLLISAWLPGLSCQNYTCDFPSESYCHLARILPCLSHCRFLYSNEIYPWKSERKRSKVPIHM